MSSILKALRRLEEERARQSSVAPEIAASLLRHGARRRQSPLWLWPTVIIAVAAVVAAALLWSWRPAPVTSQIVTPAASPATVVARAATAGRGGEVIIEEVIEQRQPVLLPPSAPVAIPAPQPVKVNPVAQKIEPAAVVIEVRQRPVVTAIAWQEESSARMAVVDGLPVMTGEFVGAAQIQEIRRDHILFVEAGRLFTVAIQPQ